MYPYFVNAPVPDSIRKAAAFKDLFSFPDRK